MTFRFILDNVEDEIQKHLCSGKFYEENVLEYIKNIHKENWTIIDVGANIGNHSIYFDKFLNPKIVYVFEPIIESYKILLQNVALNYCHRINLDFLGIALGNKNSTYSIFFKEKNNLGATALKENDQGNIVGIRGDDLFFNHKVDFIKIDAEGMEMEVLEGFKQTILNSRPIILVEILNIEFEKFSKFIDTIDYKILEKFEAYNHNNNYLIVDKNYV